MGWYECDLCGGNGWRIIWRWFAWPRFVKCLHCMGSGREPPPWGPRPLPPPPPPKR